MADTEFIKLSDCEEKKEERPAGSKRSRMEEQEEEQEQLRRRNVKRLEVLREEDGSVKLLEDLVFGAEEELLGRLNQEESGLLDEDEEVGGAQQEVGGAQQEVGGAQQEVGGAQQMSRQAAWVDEDDDVDEEVDMKHRYRKNLVKGDGVVSMSKAALQQRMREQFQKSMGGAPSWAASSSEKKRRRAAEDDDEDEDVDLLRMTGDLVSSSDLLPSSILRVKKCLHANSARPCQDRLTSVQFHPSAQVVMTAGLDQSICFFQVDGSTNPKIQSVLLDRFPVHQARFCRDGLSVIATGLRNRTFYVYDMIAGRVAPVHSVRGLTEARVKEFSVCPEGGALLLTGTNGYLHLLTLKTQEVVSSMKVNGNVAAVAFSPDGSKVFANSEEGEVFVWDMRSSRCVSRFSDDGCVRATSIAASPNGHFLACGSQSGVVNIYSQEACLNSASPRPLKSVKNLLTSATSLTFNPTSEILALASRAEDEAVRMVHLSSLTVFSNFPIAKRKIVYRAASMDFSPHSGFFSLANNKGHAPLFRLLHYKDF